VGFSEICNGHKVCPFCGHDGPKPLPEDKAAGCCSDAIEYGFWDRVEEDDLDNRPRGLWLFWHENDECAKGGE